MVQLNFERQKNWESHLESMTFPVIGLVVALFLLAIGVQLLRSWCRDRDDPADDSDELLDHLRDLRLEGDLSEEEFRSIKSRFDSQTKTE